MYEARSFQFEGEIPGNNSQTGLVVAFIGTFNELQPSRQIVETFRAFLDETIQSNITSDDYDLLLDDQLNTSENGLLDALKDFKNFYSCKLNFVAKNILNGEKFPVLNITTREMWGASKPLNDTAVQSFSQPRTKIMLSFVGYDLPCTNLVNF